MYSTLLLNDLKKNPWNNAILFLFIVLASTISVLVVLTLSTLFTSISSMYAIANPPHFLQMHKGELNEADIESFNEGYEGLKHGQIASLLTVPKEEILISKKNGQSFSLKECKLDISLATQNENYDVLLDSSRNPSEIGPGEIGVPVILLDLFLIEIGDTITLSTQNETKSWIVKDYVYDGQMNSTLCSSTRFLIHETDFQNLLQAGLEREYLIEAWFYDKAQGAEYQTAYEQSPLNLSKDGQAITYPIIFLLSALSDLLMAMLLFLVGFLLTAIALICLRYALLAELEQSRQAIGTMKAIGISQKGIASLYLTKIRILALAGCISGGLLAYLAFPLVATHMRQTFGKQSVPLIGWILTLFIMLSLYSVIVLFTKMVLKRLNKASIVQLLGHQKELAKKSKGKDGLFHNSWLFVNLLMGLQEVKHGYGIIFGLLFIVSIMIALPWRTIQTMSDKEFATYMGSPLGDVLIEVEPGESLEERNNQVEAFLLEHHDQIEQSDRLRRIRLLALNQSQAISIHIDSGQNAGEDLWYLEGESPKEENEIALSSLLAQELNKKVNDLLEIRRDKNTKTFLVSGIYQDVTSGGKTAKAIYPFAEERAEKYSYILKVKNKEDFIALLQKQFGPGYSMKGMESFIDQTLGGLIGQLKQISLGILLIGLALITLITFLFLKLRFTQNAADLAMKKAIGIPFLAIQAQELIPLFMAGLFGALSGMLIVELLGPFLISGLFSLLNVGLEKIYFSASWESFLLIPLLLLTVLEGIALKMCRSLRSMPIAKYLNE